MHQKYQTHDFFKLLLVLKKTFASKWLNGITEIVWDIKHHTEQ